MLDEGLSDVKVKSYVQSQESSMSRQKGSVDVERGHLYMLPRIIRT